MADRPVGSSESALTAEVKQQIDLMLAACAGDPAPLDAEYRARYLRIAETSRALNLPDPFHDFGTLWDWVAKAAELPGPDEQRAHLFELAEPLLDLIALHALPQPLYEIDTYQRPDGTRPFDNFFGDLSAVEKAALLQGIRRVLAYEGTDVTKSEWGKNLGQGLYEFRVRRRAEEIESMFQERVGPDIALPGASESVLLRAYFYPHGDKLILLLSGFDKGARPKDEDAQIAYARLLLKEFLEGEKRAAKGAER